MQQFYWQSCKEKCCQYYLANSFTGKVARKNDASITWPTVLLAKLQGKMLPILLSQQFYWQSCKEKCCQYYLANSFTGKVARKNVANITWPLAGL